MFEVVVREKVYEIALVWENSKGRHVLEEVGRPAIIRKLCIQNYHLLSSLNVELGNRITTLLVQDRAC